MSGERRGPLDEYFEGFGKHKFRKGQRVRLSDEGRKKRLLPRVRLNASGKVLRVDNWNSPTVRWDHRRTADKYWAGFIEPDTRKKHERPNA